MQKHANFYPSATYGTLSTLTLSRYLNTVASRALNTATLHSKVFACAMIF